MTDPPQTLGRYRLVSLIGAGGMGKVYRAHDDALERDVAIKVLPPEVITDPSRVARFIQEARAASALNHPHVVTIYDIGEERVDGAEHPARFIAMELLDGQTLRELNAAGLMDLRKSVRLILQVTEALTAAHAAGIIHRDLKPENIMVTAGGYPKVLDFGLAKLRATSSDDGENSSRTLAKETDPGVVLGTAGYLSPEQALGKQVDARTDLFAIGCILYELATGRRAFHGDSSVDTLHKVIYNEPEPIRSLRPDVPAELVRILRKALAKDPDERYQTAKDLAIDLRELLRDLESGSNLSGASPAAVASKAAPSRRHLLTGIIALAIMAAIVFAIFRLRTPPVPQATEPLRITRVTASGKVIGAAISLDGKFIAYVVSDQGEQSLWVRQMASGQSLELVPKRRVSYWGLAFAPDASIYYGEKSAAALSGAIYQISTLGGTPRRIITEIDSPPTFSPDGKQMAFLRAQFPTEAESALIVAAIDGTGARALAKLRTPEVFVPIFYAGPSWSPDGKRIAVGVTNRSTHQGYVAAVEAASGAITPIAKGDWQQVAQVAWLPDQTGLLAVAQRKNETLSQVFRVSYPEGKVSQVTNDLFDYRVVSLTADGRSLLTVASDISADVWIHADGAPPKRITGAKLEGANGLETTADGRILFSSLESGKHDIWIMNRDGSGRTLLTRDQHENTHPALTPDGRTIVYRSRTVKQTEICRMNLDGSDRRVLAQAIPGAVPNVSPDGKWVIYGNTDLTSPARANILVVERVPIGGGPPERLTSYLSLSPAYSPDGSEIALYAKEPASDALNLAIIPASGGMPKKAITFSSPFFFSSRIRWSADGKSLFVNTAPSDRANLWRVPLDGSAPEKLTNFDEHTLFHFAPLRDEKGWVLSRGDLSRDAVVITGF